jgi:hypothetical protein
MNDPKGVRNMKAFAMMLALASMLAASGARAERVDCEPARCAVQSAIAAQCSCDTATNHGQYVSCVAHIVRQLAANGTVPVTCKGKVTRCAAKSVCGKPGFVTCQIPTDTCTIPVGALTGTCTDDPAITCATDLDCGAKCKVKSTSDRCTASGGFVGTASSCCAACTQ